MRWRHSVHGTKHSVQNSAFIQCFNGVFMRQKYQRELGALQCEVDKCLHWLYIQISYTLLEKHKSNKLTRHLIDCLLSWKLSAYCRWLYAAQLRAENIKRPHRYWTVFLSILQGRRFVVPGAKPTNLFELSDWWILVHIHSRTTWQRLINFPFGIWSTGAAQKMS